MGNETRYGDYEAACGAVRWITGPAMFNPEVFEFLGVDGARMRLELVGVELVSEDSKRTRPIARFKIERDGVWLCADGPADPVLVAMYMSVRSRIRR
jgi:hypothetical protein